MSRQLRHTRGIFEHIFRDRFGDPLDLSGLVLEAHPPTRIVLAQRVWQERLRTEFRSVQIMTRFLAEVLGAGDPLEVYGAALDLVEDEIRHVGLCAQLVQALGAEPLLPDPVELRDPPRYLEQPMMHRALTTAIQMLAINETISVAFIEDLHARCTDPAVRQVLGATCEDEEGHEELGWTYVKTSLARFKPSTRDSWRHLVERSLAPHRSSAKKILDGLDPAQRDLEAHPEAELAALGLFSPVRQALVFELVWREKLEPRLRALELL